MHQKLHAHMCRINCTFLHFTIGSCMRFLVAFMCGSLHPMLLHVPSVGSEGSCV